MSNHLYLDTAKVYFWNKCNFVQQECPLKYYLTYAVALDFPFLDELNDLLTRFTEAGLYDKWGMDTRLFLEEHYKPLIAHSPKGLKAYSMNDLWFAFILLFVGYTMSMIVLIFEFIFQKIKKIE